MKIQCTDNKTFELIDESNKLGQLSYNRLFSFKATLEINKHTYVIEPFGVLKTSVLVTKDDIEIANMKMNWKGQIIISYHSGEEFVLKATGTFLNKYVIENNKNEKLMLLSPDFNWAKFNYNYDISFDKKPDDILLVLLAAYSANYFIASMSASI